MLINAVMQRLPERCGVDFTVYANMNDRKCLFGAPYLYETMEQVAPIPVIGWIMAILQVIGSPCWPGRSAFVMRGGCLTPLTLPFMELVGVIGMPIAYAHGWVACIFLLLTIAITSCDVIAKWIPDVLTMSVTFLGLLSAAGYIPTLTAIHTHASDAILAYVVAWISAFLLLGAITLLTGRNALNFGDVWAFAAYAPFIGVAGLPFFGVASSIVGIAFGVHHALMRPHMRTQGVDQGRDLDARSHDAQNASDFQSDADSSVFPPIADASLSESDEIPNGNDLEYGPESIPFGPAIAWTGFFIAVTCYNPFL